MKALLLGLALIIGLPYLAEAAPGKILIVLPAANTLSTKEGVHHPTGYFLSELAIPTMILAKMGFDFDIATPEGIQPTIDKISEDPKWFQNLDEYDQAKTFLISLPGLSHPIALSKAKKSLGQYVGLFIPGGHAAMEDLPRNNDLGEILRFFHKNHLPTALICHGPAALLSAKNANGDWIYKNYNLTMFSKAEEQIEEQTGALDGHVLFYVEDIIKQMGGNVYAASPWQSHVVVDRELVTGQNPQSDRALTSAFIQLLFSEKKVLEKFEKLHDVQAQTIIGAYTTIFVGVRKQNYSSDVFINRLQKHIALCESEFNSYHLTSYIAYADENIEVAYQTWPSKEALDQAIQSVGSIVAGDASQFMDSLIFEQTQYSLNKYCFVNRQ